MSEKTPFSKKPLTVPEQLDLLKTRKLIIADEAQASFCLNRISFYRLSSYFSSFEDKTKENHLFLPNTTFEQITTLYSFDRELRLLVQDAIERVEVALRTAISNHMSIHYGAQWYVNKAAFAPQWSQCYGKQKQSPQAYFLKELDEICKKQKEPFIKNYYQHYTTPLYPPSWMVIECLSMGSLANLLRNLKEKNDKKAICAIFNQSVSLMESFLEPFRYIRNICAHHGRLWNQWFVYNIRQAKAWKGIPTVAHSFHEQALLIMTLLKPVELESRWVEKLWDLFEQYKGIPIDEMGFCTPWESDPIWNF